ncbi:MAG TPA: condensation domain-containing protein [Egibacteraceae bacterium]|nr:condensation domain-containing protein [Egibacteraceae bacterium]
MSSEAAATHLQGSGPSAGPDQAAFLRELEASERFQRDNAVGRIFHPGAVSYRQAVAENSVHFVWERGRLLAHVDRYSPVRFTKDGTARYAFWRVAVHNVAGAVTDVLSLPHRQHSGERCPTAGETIEVDADLLDEFLNALPEGADAADVALDRLRARLLPDTEEGVQRLSFNLVDEVVHLLDTPEEPWSVQLEVRVTGHLDEPRLRKAVDEALRRHPMARAREAASQRAWNRHYWEIPLGVDVDPLQGSQDDDDAASARARLHSTPISLATSPPLRVLLLRQREGDILMLTLHHAATDGFGALRLLQSIARAYAGDPDPLPRVDLLAARDLMGGHAAADASMKVHRYLALVERLRELVAPPARLARHQGREIPGYGFHHVGLSAEETRRLADCKHAGTVNDRLVAALHLAVAAWNSRHRRACRRITVLVPSNLRPKDLRNEMVGNFALPARVTTTPRRRTSAAATLAAVTAQTTRKKRSGLGTSLLELLSWSWLMPLRVKQALIDRLDQRFTDTVVLSNLGRITESPSFGDGGETVECWFSAPARMPAGLSIGAVTLNDRLHLAFRYRHPQFGPDAARCFAECYIAQLRRVMTHP